MHTVFPFGGTWSMDYQAIKRRLNTRSSNPQYRQLVEVLEDHIHSNRLKAGVRLPAQRDLMLNLALSDSTVCRAIRELTARGALYCRQGQGTFVADRAARESSTIAVLVPAHPGAPYDRDIVWNIEDAAHQAGCDVVLCNTEDNMLKVDSYFEKLSQKKVAGAIYVPAATAEGYYEKNIERIRRFQGAGIAVVLCDRNFLNRPEAVASLDIDCVYSDDMNGSSELVGHLIENGAKRIALVSPPMDSNVENRIVGYRKALVDHDLVYSGELVKFVESYDTREDVAGVVDELLGLPDRPDAIFAINDRMAEVVMGHLADRGISVPHQIAIVGYDNIERSRYLDVPLTTVDRDNAEMGRVAMKLLLERIAGTRTTPRHIALPTKLIVRESCGSPPKKNKQTQTYITTNKKQMEAMPMRT